MKKRTGAGIIALSAPAIYYLIKKRGGAAKISSAIRRGTLATRNAEIVRLGARVGATYATASARKVFSSAERRQANTEALRIHAIVVVVICQSLPSSSS